MSTFYLYTEGQIPLCDGPYHDFDDVMRSPLWEYRGVCVWIEKKTPVGFAYENVKWTEEGWFTTSFGTRPLPAIQPEGVFLGINVVRSDELSPVEKQRAEASRVEALRRRNETELYRSMLL